ncbi:MAG: hypothetical protein DME76_16605 [Verrucomicrobia bacterium]|nr:MAG: hypothetical protein DME76_16605 [Verrucomicrobiota bacterium]
MFGVGCSKFSRFEKNNDSSVSSAESVVLQSFSTFPRNLTPNFRLYIRQRPEMNSSTTRNQRRPKQQKEIKS